jgi:hypothetical protein
MNAANRKTGLMPPWKPGQSGNPSGRLRGFNRILRDLLSKRELNGEPCPGGRTVEECLAEATLMRAIKGDNACLIQVLDRIYGPRGSIETSDGARVVFEIIPNGRERPAELEDKPADDDAGPPENESNG